MNIDSSWTDAYEFGIGGDEGRKEGKGRLIQFPCDSLVTCKQELWSALFHQTDRKTEEARVHGQIGLRRETETQEIQVWSFSGRAFLNVSMRYPCSLIINSPCSLDLIQMNLFL